MRPSLAFLTLAALACSNEKQESVTLAGPSADAAANDNTVAADEDSTASTDAVPVADQEPADLTAADADAALPDTPAPPDTADDAVDATADAQPACVVSADCPGGKDLCLQGKCVAQVPCQSDKQCAASGQVCEKTAGVCVQCLTGTDCQKGLNCKAHQCIPPPESCLSSKDCKTGQVCDKDAKQCVECATMADCDKGFACQETVCVPLACTPGASVCKDAATLSVCKPDGSGVAAKACAQGQVCLDNACKTQSCTPGNKFCDGTKVMLCDGTCTAPTLVQDCLASSKEKSICDGGQCVPAPVGQSGYLLRGGFQTVPDAAGGNYRAVDQGWFGGSVCDGGYCLQGGFAP
jgi:hypothetical protein